MSDRFAQVNSSKTHLVVYLQVLLMRRDAAIWRVEVVATNARRLSQTIAIDLRCDPWLVEDGLDFRCLDFPQPIKIGESDVRIWPG